MYETPRYLTKALGNNAFAPAPGRRLFVPKLVSWSMEDVRMGREIVFRESGDDWLVECHGLESFIRTQWQGIDVFIFDNHNHALSFWCLGIQEGILSPGFELVHIDMHSDLWENSFDFDIFRVNDVAYIEDFVDTKCNVGNYIVPAIRSGLVQNMIRIEGEQELLAHQHDRVSKNSVLNLDLDFFASDLDDISFDLKRRVILQFARQVSCIAIATSPFFIEQERALEKMREVFAEGE